MLKLNKAVEGDKRSILSQNLHLSYSPAGEFDWIYLLDYNDEVVYFEQYDYDNGAYLTYQLAYTYNGTMATFEDEPVEVVRTTEYVVVEAIDNAATIERSVLKTLTKFFGGSKENKTLPIIKDLNEEQMVAVEPLYIAPGSVDGQAETIDQDGVESLVKSVNEGIASGELKANYFHSVDTEDFHFLKSWVNPCDCIIGETEVMAGTPLIEVQYVSKGAWDKRKSGELMGLSIEGTADVEEL